MSDFRAKITATLDTTKIPGEIKQKIESQTVHFSKFALDTTGLPSQIQASLDKHKFKIVLDGIKTTDIEKQAKSSGSKAGKSFSQSFVSEFQLKTLDNKIVTWMDKNTKAVKPFGKALEDLREKLSNLNLADPDVGNQFKQLKQEFELIKSQAQALGKTGKTLGVTFKNAFESISKYVSVSSVIHTTLEAFKQMYQNVYDIDTAMTNLYKVTDETSARYNKFLESATKNAKELGRTISGVVEQTANWAKLGYSLDEAEELSKLSSIYANVAEVDDATAVSDMVTAMKAFKLETNEAVTIVDSLNELGKILPMITISVKR